MKPGQPRLLLNPLSAKSHHQLTGALRPVSPDGVTPKRPRGGGWKPSPAVEAVVRNRYRTIGLPVVPVEAWVRGRVLVVSTVDHPRGVTTWSVSVSERGAPNTRPGRQVMARVRRDFDMVDAEEDNHAPGKSIRHLWLIVDPTKRRPCECVEEPAEVHPAGRAGDEDAYAWRPGHDEEVPRG